jgi:hypothetical protein
MIFPMSEMKMGFFNHKYAKQCRLMTSALFCGQPDESGVSGVTGEHDPVPPPVHVLPGQAGDPRSGQ